MHSRTVISGNGLHSPVRRQNTVFAEIKCNVHLVKLCLCTSSLSAHCWPYQFLLHQGLREEVPVASLVVPCLAMDTYWAGQGPLMLWRRLALGVKSPPRAKERLVLRGDQSRLKMIPVVREILTCIWFSGVGAVA